MKSATDSPLLFNYLDVMLRKLSPLFSLSSPLFLAQSLPACGSSHLSFLPRMLLVYRVVYRLDYVYVEKEHSNDNGNSTN